MFSGIKKFFGREPKRIYALNDVYGCSERVPAECPTFIEREVHRAFRNNIKSYNINVVYGESRQGKTWMVDRYCSNQLRVGCQANMTLNELKTQMLNVAGIQIRKINHSITEDTSVEIESFSKVGMELAMSAGISGKESCGHSETIATAYNTVDIENQASFLEAIKDAAADSFFVFDNFHYLDPKTQQAFCALLKEFNYQGIRIVIIGVWKDASRITALAPDLVNRCGHVDVGSWTEAELREVLKKGDEALNISIGESCANIVLNCCAENIGIFKDMLQKFCQCNNVFETLPQRRELDSDTLLNQAMNQVVQEAYVPLHDRIVNLAKPQRERKDSKHIRMKIIISLLEIISRDKAKASAGISLDVISDELNNLCTNLGQPIVDISNLTQELGMLHLREENRQTGNNFISLFFYDKANKKILVLDPTIYVVKNYAVNMIESIIEELKVCLLVYDFESLV